MPSSDPKSRYLVAGLGNPGKRYAKTRHNLGFYVLDHYLAQQGLAWKKGRGAFWTQFSGVFFVKPQSYMNLSGGVVYQFLRFYKIALAHFLVVADDTALPFGRLRLRESGSSGGHNGLGNIEKVLGTRHYARLRVGVGTPQEDSDMVEHVLGRFTQKEAEMLPQIASEASQAIELWLQEGANAMNVVNVHPKQKENMDEKNEEKPL